MDDKNRVKYQKTSEIMLLLDGLTTMEVENILSEVKSWINSSVKLDTKAESRSALNLSKVP